MMNAHRILIYGVTGSGKSTFAERLSRAIGIPWHSVDELTWEPGWVEVPLDVQRERFERICAEPEWILDTAYGKWVDIPLSRAELIIALDYPRWVSLGRLLRRTICRVADGKAVCNGNRETFANAFLSRDSLLLWHFRSFRSKRERVRAWQADPRAPSVLRFSRPKEAEEWLKKLCAKS